VRTVQTFRDGSMSTTLPPPRIRVVLVDLPQLTRDLIARILDDEPGVHLVCDVVEAGVPVRQLIEKTAADIVIIGTDAPALLSECHELVDAHAPWRVLAVSSDGRDAHLYGVRPYAMAVDEFSLNSVLEIVRKSANSRLQNLVSDGRSRTKSPTPQKGPER
jgi:DNA-binding NarL/FixJ family response regulator